MMYLFIKVQKLSLIPRSLFLIAYFLSLLGQQDAIEDFLKVAVWTVQTKNLTVVSNIGHK